MKKFVAIFGVILTIFIYVAPLPVLALNVEVGQQVRLKARNDLGVPLHKESFPSLFDRVEDGTIAEVLDTANDKRWLNIKTAIQEIKTTTNARNAWDKVTQKLNEYTGDDWDVILNSCGRSDSQHVGFLYNKDKLKASNNKEVWQYNGRADDASNACKDNLRPGYLAYFEADNGFDFYAVSVHSDSGRKNKDLTTRQTAVERIDDVTSGLADIDKDIVILGDFNTMGIDEGISAKQEIKELKDKVTSESPGLKLLTVQPSCTHYYQKKPGWLDHILVSQDTSELVANSASVQGYCAINSCNSISGSLPQAAVSLSDHCPILVDFNNSDLD